MPINTHLSLTNIGFSLLQNNKKGNLKFTVKRIIFLLNQDARQDTSFTYLPGEPSSGFFPFFSFLH